MSLIIRNFEPQKPGSDKRLWEEDVGGQRSAAASNMLLAQALQANESTLNEVSNTLLLLKIQAENLTSARTRIADMDIAMDMAGFIKEKLYAQNMMEYLVQPCDFQRMAMALMGR